MVWRLRNNGLNYKKGGLDKYQGKISEGNLSNVKVDHIRKGTGELLTRDFFEYVGYVSVKDS